jgi:hypothetical protein
MKNSIVSFGLFLALVLNSIAVKAQWVVDQDYAFKINVPAGWTKEKKQDGSDRIHDFMDPSQNIFVEVRSFKAADGITVDNMANVFENTVFPGAERLAYEAYHLNNVSGKFAGYKTEINGLEVGIGAFYTVNNDFAYILWSLIPINVYNQYSALSDQVMNTFQVIPKQIKARPIASKPTFQLSSFRLSDKITEDYEIYDEKYRYPVNTKQIWLVYRWKGNCPGAKINVNWYYQGEWIEGPSADFIMPDYPNGFGFANIKMNSAFKVGKYSVEVLKDNQLLKSADFEVYAPVQNNIQHTASNVEASSIQWGHASSSVTTSKNTKNTSAKIKTIQLGGKDNFYSFKNGIVQSSKQADLMNEPWCTERPALCGNWARTGMHHLAEVTEPPASGYISDKTSYTDCKEIPLNEVLVFKLKDGTYAKVLVVSDDFSRTTSGCNHTIKLKISYPAF